MTVIKAKAIDVSTRYFRDYGIKHAKESFRLKHMIEAFAYLHALIEINLYSAWINFVLSTQGTKAIKKWEYSKDWNYSQLVRLFDQLGELNKSELKTLRSFNDSRNKVVHTFANLLLTKIPWEEKKLTPLFENGLKAHEISETLQKKFYNQVSKKKIWEKWKLGRKNGKKSEIGKRSV